MVKVAAPLLLLLPSLLYAGELESIEIEREGKRYSVSMVAVLDATPEQAWAVLSDQDALPKLNDAIDHITYSDSPDPEASYRATSLISLCVLFFCKNLDQTQDMYQQPNHLRAVVISELSDFEYGFGDWRIVDRGGKSELQFTAALEPKFWIPPLIGPWVIRRKMAKEAEVTMHNIEQLALAH